MHRPVLRCSARRRHPAWVAGAAALILAGTAGTAALSGSTATAADATATAAEATATAADATVTAADEGQAAYLAAQLRKNPVYITDQAPRVTPRSAAPAFAKQARRTGVPTYILVLPAGVTAGERDLLPRVHDRLGEDGLYLLLSERGYQTAAAAFGVDVPYEEANRAALYETAFDTPPLEYLTRFVDVLRLGAARAEARAESAAEKYGPRSGNEPERRYVAEWQREDQSRQTGLLLGGVPLLILGVGWYGYRLRNRRVLHPVVLLGVAGASALAIGLVASSTFDQKRANGAPLPTSADMWARTDRVVAGLREAPVYVDPESANPFTAAQVRRLTEHAEESRVPVRVMIVPSGRDDEAGGDQKWFARGVHQKLGEDAVYLLADPRSPHVEMLNFGVRLDDGDLRRIDDEIFADAQKAARKAEAERGTEDGGTADAPGLYELLDGVVTDLGTVGSGPPGEPNVGSPPETPEQEQTIPPLFSGEFTGGLWEGAGLAALATGLVAAVGAGVRRFPGRFPGRLARRLAVRSAGASGVPKQADGDGAHESPRAPGARWLRRTAGRELEELREEFDRRSDHLPDAARARVWDCLDAAALLLDRDADGAVDKDADQPTLMAAVALLRAGRHALGDAGPDAALPARLCGINPLHGPASTGTRRFRRTRGRKRAQPRPVCAGCAALLDDPGTAERVGETRLLHVVYPGRGGRNRTPYDVVPGPLVGKGGALLGIHEILSNVRESAGVH